MQKLNAQKEQREGGRAHRRGGEKQRGVRLAMGLDSLQTATEVGLSYREKCTIKQ